tara:strand:+ start:432 stop:1796 length:1365 start_codon:yes stop_codon:yes gene_type:complete
MANYRDLKYTFPASSIASGTFADARLSQSSVNQYATSFDDNQIVNDISTLALKQASDENKGSYNTDSTYVDVFQDSTGYTNGANTTRDSNEYVSSTSNVAEANTKALWTTTIDSHGDAIGGSGEGTPIVDSTGTLQLQSTNTGVQTFSSGNSAPISGFGTRSIRTAGWSTSTDYGGLFIREKSGQTSDLNFASGALTIEMFVKQVSSGFSNAHQYIFDLQNGSNHRLTMAPHGTTNSSAYNGSLMSDGDYSWSNFGVGNWRHVALVRDGSGNISSFINGTRVQAATGKTENLTMTDSNELSIGQRLNGENSGYLYINNIRFSNIARYSPTSSSLTVPTSRFTYLTSTLNATGNFTCPNVTASSSTNKMGAIVTYQNHAGTNTLNTDIILQLSADGGSNFATATMTAMPDFSTGIKMAKVNDLSVTAGTQLKYKISFANQSGSKEARIRGVSLQY